MLGTQDQNWPRNHIECYNPVVAQVERSQFCRQLIAQRMEDGLCDPGAIHEDITTIHHRDLGSPDGYCAGFPCQVGVCSAGPPHFPQHPGQGVSNAGDGLGLLDCRSNLVTHLFRLHDEAAEDGDEVTLDMI